MMKRKQKAAIAIALISALSLSAGIFVACGKDQPTTPPDYGFENPPTDDVAKPDEGFTIDGKFDEAAYANQKWFHGVKLEKTEDGLIYNNAASNIETAAKFSMTSIFGEKGIYIATSYKAADGEMLYVNPGRVSYMNSITELYFAAPGFTSINDDGVCEIDMEPTGKLTFKRRNATSEQFVDFATTNDIMAQLGVTCNGEVGESISAGSQRATEYTCELFIPWAYVDKIAGEGAAEAIKNDGEIRLNAAPITSRNYDGKNKDLDRWWWMMGSQLDNGSWGNVNGWYHFNKDGLVAYDLDIKDVEGGKVMERFGYDFAVANNAVTLLIQSDEGKAISDIKVNGVSYFDQIVYPDPTSISAGYITLTAGKVTQDLTIEAAYKDIPKEPVAFTAKVYGMRFGTKYELEGATQVTLTGPQTHTLTITNGEITGTIAPGRYTAKLEGENFAEYSEILVEFLGEDFDLAFGMNAFTQGKFGSAGNTEKYQIDASHANDENGYIINKLGNSFFPTTNETFGDSVFTANFQKDQQTSDHSFLIRHIFANQTGTAIQACLKILNGKLIVQWYLGNDWGVSSIPKDEGNMYVWEPYLTLPDEFLTEFTSGGGVDLTMVRVGYTFHVFASIKGGEKVVYFRSYTVSEETYSDTGYWAISIMNSAAGARVHFALDDSANATDAWTTYEVNVTTQGNGSVSGEPHHTVAVGETLTLTITPDDGYFPIIKVNGVIRQITGGKLELTAADGLSIDVEVTFEQIAEISFELEVETDLLRLGKTVSLEGASVILTGEYTTKTLEISGGKITGTIMVGTYKATLSVYTGAIVPVTLEIAENGTVSIDKLVFTYDAFIQGLGTSVQSTKIDASKANTEQTITNITGNAFFPTMNEALGESVFSATFKQNQQQAGKNNSFLIRYIFTDKKTAIQACIKVINGKLSVQWNLGNDWGVSSPAKDEGQKFVWEPVMQLPTAFHTAYTEGDGVTLTMVRSGNTYSVFASINEGEEVVFFRSYTYAKSTEKGYWAISIFDSAAGAVVPFELEEGDEAINNWLTYNVALTTGSNGTATLDKTTAKVGEKVTLTVAPNAGYYAIVTVNGVVTPLTDDTTLEIAIAEGNGKTVTVDVTFEEIELVDIEIGVNSTMWRLGKEVSLNGKDVVFTGVRTYKITIANGKVVGQVQPGTYQVALDAYTGAVNTVEVTIDDEGNANVDSLTFAYDAFTQGKFGTMGDTAVNDIDDSHANDANGYIINKEGVTKGSSFFPTMNEAVGNSVFSATFKQGMQTKDNALMLRYIFASDGATKSAIQVATKILNGNLILQWYVGNEWGVNTIPKDEGNKLVWEPYLTLPAEFLNEVKTGNGVTISMVRDGNTFHVLASIKNFETVVYFRSYTVASTYAATGYWAISILDSKMGAQVPFTFEEDASKIEELLTYNVTAEKKGEGLGTVKLNNQEITSTTAKIGEKVTVTVTPDPGYYASSVLVNGQSCNLTDGKIELAVTEGSATSFKVEVTFAEKNEALFTIQVANLQRLGKSVSLIGKTILLKSTSVEESFVVSEDGTITGEIIPGTYTATLSGYGDAVATLQVTISKTLGETTAQLAFTYSAFTNAKFGTAAAQGTTIDITHANDEDGYVTKVSGAYFFPTMNEAVGNSAFTINSKASHVTKANSNYIGYIFEGTTQALMAVLKVDGANLIMQWNKAGNWGVTSIAGTTWDNTNLPESFKTAFQSDVGVNLTMVRNDAKIYVVATIPETDELFVCRTWDLSADYAAKQGYWSITILDSVDNVSVHFKLEENEDAIDEWVRKAEQV